jgi:protein-arginine kinase activator protein McsA
MNVPFGEPGKLTKGPALPLCYICGRQFGTSSILLHEPKCMQKWENEQSKLPKAQRLPRPVRPQFLFKLEGSVKKGELEDLPSDLLDEMEAYNEQAVNEFQEHGRAQCPHCKRKFAQDRLEIHLRSCNSDSSFFARHSHRNNKENKSASIENGTSKSPPKVVPDSTTHATQSKSENRTHKLDLFCGDCGTKYSGHSSKFCSECGAKRKTH